ncbi:MAG: hypothetical protein RIM72_10995 [Alphaproteobacteria bacterium]
MKSQHAVQVDLPDMTALTTRQLAALYESTHTIEQTALNAGNIDENEGLGNPINEFVVGLADDLALVRDMINTEAAGRDADRDTLRIQVSHAVSCGDDASFIKCLAEKHAA